MRANGNTAWLERKDWKGFMEYGQPYLDAFAPVVARPAGE